MELVSKPVAIADFSMLGDYALSQNAANRGDNVLDGIVDTELRPAHEVWKGLYKVQVNTEGGLAAALGGRDTAFAELGRITRKIHTLLTWSLGEKSPELERYLPDGKCAFLRGTHREVLTRISPYVEVITTAPEDLLATAERDSFLKAFTQSADLQSRWESLKGAAKEAAQDREDSEATWRTAYDNYHRAVEWKCGSDRRMIQTLIKRWPLAAHRKVSSPVTTTSAPA